MTLGTLPTLIYDGDCGFCTRCARWAEQHARVAIEPSRTGSYEQYGLTATDVAARVYVIDQDRQPATTTRHTPPPLGGGRAVARVLQRCNHFWLRTLGYFIDLPGLRLITELGYRVVARNRHRLPGTTGNCAIR